MILFKSAVIGDTKYSFSNQQNLTIFDVHNDSPYNMAISFNGDVGINNADYYTSPHSILYGIGAINQKARSIGGVKFSGTVYIYTETPLGGGSANLATAPASQISVIGYPTGFNPIGTTSLSRMTTTANNVGTTNMGSSLVNTTNVAPTTNIIQIAPTGDPGTVTSLDNIGNFVNGDAAHPGTVKLDNNLISSDGAGNLAATSFNKVLMDINTGTNGVQIGKTAVNDLLDQTATDLYLKAVGSGAKFIFFNNGAAQWTLSHMAKLTASLVSGHQTFTHNLGWQPDFCIGAATVGGGGSATFGWDSPTTTQIGLTAGATLHFDLIFIKF